MRRYIYPAIACSSATKTSQVSLKLQQRRANQCNYASDRSVQPKTTIS
ncbi:hypothetical protein [Chroococcidiopsis sp. CCNUC1]|nr:hypothetical protein [Chroococcidiopsis sp. CCNUC1]URD50263.1 hypothetical protein M5J74_28695 [Chroococcidiopsis sp. CCNUC1]